MAVSRRRRRRRKAVQAQTAKSWAEAGTAEAAPSPFERFLTTLSLRRRKQRRRAERDQKVKAWTDAMDQTEADAPHARRAGQRSSSRAETVRSWTDIAGSPWWPGVVRVVPQPLPMRLALLLVGCVVAALVLWLSGGAKPGLQLLNRNYPGVLAVFLLLLVCGGLAATRTWLGRSPGIVAIGAAAAFPCYGVAFHLYYLAFQHEQWRRSLSSTDLLTTLQLSFAVWPTFTLAWVFGGLAALVYLLLAWVISVRRAINRP